MSEQKYAFPTEVLALPSKGLLYPKDHPLSSGQIDVKYMTAKEEDILTSTNLIDKGIVIDRVLESVIANDKIKLNDMLLGDKNALMVGTRVLGYGPEYTVKLTDPDTTLEVEHSFDLTKLNNVEIDYDSLKKIHEETIKIKEQQINDLNLMLKEEMEPNHTEWWVLGGVTIGILLSVAVFYASVEIAK